MGKIEIKKNVYLLHMQQVQNWDAYNMFAPPFIWGKIFYDIAVFLKKIDIEYVAIRLMISESQDRYFPHAKGIRPMGAKFRKDFAMQRKLQAELCN